MNAAQKKLKNDGNQELNNSAPYELPIIDAAAVGILISRISDDEILYANKAIADLLGISDTGKIIGKRGFNFYWDENDYQMLVEQFRAQGILTNRELRARHANDSMFWVLISVRHCDFQGEQALISEIIDITEHKHAEETLHKNQSLYQSLIEVLPMSVCRKDLAGRFTFANQRFLDVSEITLADLLGKSDADLHPSELADKYRRDDLAVMESGQVQELIEERAIHGGGTAYVQTIKSPIYDETGKISGIQISFWDITNRKQAEEAIQASEERFRRFTEATNEGLVFHEQGKIVDANPAALAMFGLLDPTEFIGKNLLQFIVPESHEMVLKQMQLENVLPYEVWCFRKDSTIFPVETSTSAYKIDGRTIRATSIRDITARKQAEKAIQESEERFRRFTEATVEGLVFHQQGKIVDTNPAVGNIFGYSDVKELIGRNLLEFIMPEFHQLVMQQMESESVLPYEIQGIRKDGTIFPIETSTRAYKDGERIIRASSIRDITERKQAGQALQESQRLLQLVMDNIPQAVFWKDKELTYLGTNKAFAEDAGFDSPQALVGKTDFDMPWKEQGELYRADDQRILELGEAKLNYEEPQTGPTGEITWLRTSKIPMRDIDGKIFAVLGMYEDITEWKRLQQQVQEAFERRGYQVQISTEISQEVAAASELNDLFHRVVTLTKERLGYYHTQLLRYDAAQDAVVLINGYGETGQKMLADRHQLPMGEGLIGTAAASGETVLRSTLAEDPDWQPNPLLPETKGEIAVPIKWQDSVLGVLDVQSNEAGALDEDDRILLEGLCGQIAIAMHSAELVKAVRQNEARLAEALETTHLANWEYDVEKDLFTFNDQFYSIFHTTVEKAGGYQLSSARYAELFVYPDDMGLVGGEIGKALSSTERVYNTTIDHRILYADGGIGYITVRLTVERDETGKITRYYGANQDITERKQAEARLAEALRTARLANWEYDVEKDLFTFNDQFYSIFHTTVEKAGGYQLSSARYAELFVYPEDMELVGIEIGKALSSTEKVYNATLDHRILYADGGIGYITVKLTVERDENGKITRYYGANQDVTEQKTAEAALRHSEQEMAERLEELNRLYRNLSREGWQTYRQTADLPAGFVYDQTSIRPVDDEVLADEFFANIPMKVMGGETVGTLTVANDPQHPTSPEDLAFLQQVSDQIALALESARLFEQTQSALAQSERLFEASRNIAQATNLRELLKTTVETLNIPVINRAGLEIFSYNAAGELDRMTLAATWDSARTISTSRDEETVGRSFTAEFLKMMPLFVSSIPMFFNDLYQDERVDAASIQVAKKQNYRALATLPLFVGTQQVGVVTLTAEEPHNFTQDEIRLFTAMAPQITTVLENRRQFERAQKQAERESTLNIISQKIQSATTVEAVLQIAARELGHALGAPRTIAQLRLKDKQ